MKLIRPVSKRDQVVAAFKDAILRGEIQPGDAIVESRVAQQLGAGVPLVREALIELEHRGYVQKAPYKGTTVTKLERRHVEQIFRLRVGLETLAIEWAKESVKPADLDHLRGLTAKMKRAASTRFITRRELMQKLWQDLRFQARRLMKQPVFILIAVSTLAMSTGFTQVKTTTIPLDNPSEMQPRNVKTEQVTYKGRKALRVADAAPANVADGIQLVILNKTEFQDGVIEIELTGEPGANTGGGARGFVGVAFRFNLDAARDAAKYECFYLRPTNGRADDQARRNHSTQYISYPDFPWNRLRKEFPEKYESYVDLAPGEWTKMKIEAHGDKARLYVHDAPQPVLVVNDLKQGQGQGQIALWVGAGTVAHFANLRVSK